MRRLSIALCVLAGMFMIFMVRRRAAEEATLLIAYRRIDVLGPGGGLVDVLLVDAVREDLTRIVGHDITGALVVRLLSSSGPGGSSEAHLGALGVCCVSNPRTREVWGVDSGGRVVSLSDGDPRTNEVYAPRLLYELSRVLAPTTSDEGVVMMLVGRVESANDSLRLGSMAWYGGKWSQRARAAMPLRFGSPVAVTLRKGWASQPASAEVGLEVPFQSRPMYAVCATGRFAAIESNLFDLRIFDESGRLHARVVRPELQGPMLTDREVKRVERSLERTALLFGVSRASLGPALPSRRPVLLTITCNSSGQFVLERTTAETERRVDVYDEGGRRIAAFRLPPDVHLILSSVSASGGIGYRTRDGRVAEIVDLRVASLVREGARK